MSLIGSECEVDCRLDDVQCKACWDTGGQLSIVGSSWLKEWFPAKKVKPLEDILEENLLDVSAAGLYTIPYSGFVELRFSLNVGTGGALELLVPFLVASEGFSSPLVGNNVITELTERGETDINIKKCVRNINRSSLNDVLNLNIRTPNKELDNVVRSKKTSVIRAVKIAKSNADWIVVTTMVPKQYLNQTI